MGSDQVRDIIIPLIKASKEKGTKNDKHIKGDGIEIINCSYLLNQLLRNILIPEENYHISKAADKLWKSLTSSDIKDYGYDETFICDMISDFRELPFYKGNENNPEMRTVTKDTKIKYNNVFHNEHVIPIKIIIRQLQACDLDDYDAVKKILNSIHICRITKEEDKKLKQKSNREGGFDDIVKGLYKNNGIELVDYNYD